MSDDYTVVTLFPEFRARLGLGRERLAHMLKIPIPTLNMWESGAAEPTPAQWRDIEAVVKRHGKNVQDMLLPVRRLAEEAAGKAPDPSK